MAEQPKPQTYDGWEMTLRFDAGDRRQVRAASLVRAFDAWNQVKLEEHGADTHLSARRLQLVTESGAVLTGYFVFQELARSLRLLWPLGVLTWVPGVEVLGLRWYPGESTASPEPAGQTRPTEASAVAKDSTSIKR